MPMGKGTYGSQMGRPKKKKRMPKMGGMMVHGDKKRMKKGTGGRMMYADGGMPKLKPN
tara:strand:- start:160 stop:333 length:174 start_codon:yes stop_codon:yes gene_type:complete